MMCPECQGETRLAVCHSHYDHDHTVCECGGTVECERCEGTGEVSAACEICGVGLTEGEIELCRTCEARAEAAAHAEVR